MLFPARRLAHVATRTARTLRRYASTETNTEVGRLHATLRAVYSLRTDPSVLPELVTAYLALPTDGSNGHEKKLLAMLNENPSVSNRWKDAATILDRVPDKPFQIALQPSHAKAVEVFQAPENAGITIRAARRIIQLRYADAPFIALEHVLRIAETLPAQELALEHWLARLPQNLTRISTNWERQLFDLDATRQEAVRQLRALEEKKPELLAKPDFHARFMGAYAATRVAPDDAMRHWTAILSEGKPVSHRVAERALAASRDLDTLERVWAQVQKVTPRASIEGSISPFLPMVDLYYAQHLVRLGARDAALSVAKPYVSHRHLAWVLGARPDDTQPSAQKLYRLNQKSAAQLTQNGLDFEDVLFVMAKFSPFATPFPGPRDPPATHCQDLD
ncbi:hypothetical protein EXIGLDRAFT_218845 [Exidia glandulosa HHB12029]|uniref:Uncharacterized protein n=1 Tax=Exidia glandulosa HHB12029 TaxID=1314781 RepID=A0A165EDN6_EXIGL|nr:hypothetical protein EXIGLDRAFT_218845 [Exidia glandulosa HHB12029]